jgi:hypothetical protein
MGVETGAISDVQSLSVAHPSRTAFEVDPMALVPSRAGGLCPNLGAAAV